MSDSATSMEPTAPRESAPKKAEQRLGLFARITRFVREVVAELKKVVRPTRDEVMSYTTTVLVFVAIIMAFVTLVDLGVGKITFWVFGN